jgi:hypothetical protein
MENAILRGLAELPLSLIGNIIAFVALACKSVYDLYFNGRKFRQDVAGGMDALDALKAKVKRNNTSTTLTFLVTTISFVWLIGADIMSKEGVFQESLGKLGRSLDDVDASLQTKETRLKRIEDTLWPPEGPGTYGKPTPPPRDPSGSVVSLEDLSKLITELQGKDKALDERLTKVIHTIGDMKNEIHAQKTQLAEIQRLLPAGASH